MGKRLLVIKKLKALMSNGQSGQSDSGVEAEGACFVVIVWGTVAIVSVMMSVCKSVCVYVICCRKLC